MKARTKRRLLTAALVALWALAESPLGFSLLAIGALVHRAAHMWGKSDPAGENRAAPFAPLNRARR